MYLTVQLAALSEETASAALSERNLNALFDPVARAMGVRDFCEKRCREMLFTCSPWRREVMIEMREIEMRELIEAELDGVAGGMISQDLDGKHPSSPNGGGCGEPIDSRWSQHPIYLAPGSP
jgi:hypothetical protein